VPAAALFTFVIVLAPPLIDLARYSSPDMLCTLVFTAGFVLVLLDITTWGVAVMTLSILVRPDAVLLTAPLVGVLALRRQLPVGQAVAWLTIGLLPALYLIGAQGVIGEYLLTETTFSQRIAHYQEGLSNLGNSYVVPMVLVAVFTLLVRRSTDHLSLFLWGALVSITGRYLLHPFMEDRFYLPAYLVILLVTWQTISPRVFRPGASKS
jgi:Gpi18-like mannosyltransferase